MTIKSKGLMALMFILALSACSDKVVKQQLSEQGAQNLGAENSAYDGGNDLSVETVAIGQGMDQVTELMQSDTFSNPNSPLSKRVIYFEYDSSNVKAEFVPVVEAHAVYLVNNPNQIITLEGHSDERGTREYNIALAEQRAKSVFNMLQVLGVMSHQVGVVSYGEEKPDAMGSDEDAFQLNRRVEVVYK